MENCFRRNTGLDGRDVGYLEGVFTLVATCQQRNSISEKDQSANKIIDKAISAIAKDLFWPYLIAW